MSNLKENLLKRCNEMLEFYTEQIHIYKGNLKKIPSGRNKMWENGLLRAETLKVFWENLKSGLESGSYEK